MKKKLIVLALFLLAGCGGGNTPAPAPATPNIVPEVQGRADITGVAGGIDQKRFALLSGGEVYDVQVFLEGAKATVFLEKGEPVDFADLSEGAIVRVIGAKNPDKVLADTVSW